MQSILDFLMPLLMNFAQSHPALLVLFVGMGMLRSVFKPLMMLLEAIVKASPSQDDDKKLAEVEQSKLYLGLAALVDYLASVKLPGYDK